MQPSKQVVGRWLHQRIHQLFYVCSKVDGGYRVASRVEFHRLQRRAVVIPIGIRHVPRRSTWIYRLLLALSPVVVGVAAFPAVDAAESLAADARAVEVLDRPVDADVRLVGVELGVGDGDWSTGPAAEVDAARTCI